MLDRLPLEINYNIWEICPDNTLLLLGFVDKLSYCHLLDEIRSVDLYYRHSKNRSLSKIKLLTKLNQIFGDHYNYKKYRHVISENSLYNIQAKDFYGINKSNCHRFNSWFEENCCDDTDIIFISPSLVCKFDIIEHWPVDVFDHTQYSVYDRQSKAPILIKSDFHPYVYGSDDYFYIMHGICDTDEPKSYKSYRESSTTVSKKLNADTSNYFNRMSNNITKTFVVTDYFQKLKDKDAKFKRITYHLLPRFNGSFWPLVDTSEYHIIGLLTKDDDGTTTLIVKLLDKSLIDDVSSDTLDLQLHLFESFHTKISLDGPIAFIKASNDYGTTNTIDSKFYVIASTEHAAEIMIFDLIDKKFIPNKLTFKYEKPVIGWDTMSQYPVTFRTIDNKYLLLTFHNRKISLYWIRTLSNRLILDLAIRYESVIIDDINIIVGSKGNGGILVLNEYLTEPPNGGLEKSRSYLYRYSFY